jgi:acyl-coenzyme A synthetase/AMP-(fatty) acid ligase
MGVIKSCLRRQAEMLGGRRAAEHGAVRLSFAQLNRGALRVAAELDDHDYPPRMPVYVDTTDGNWCSSLIGFFGSIVGGRIPILAPYTTAPMGPFGRLAVSSSDGIAVTLQPGAITVVPDYAHHFANPLDIVMSSGSTGLPKAYLFDEAHFAHEPELRAPRHELRALHFGIPFPTSTAAHAIVIRHLMMGVTSIHLQAVGSRKMLLEKIDELMPFEVSATPYALSPLFGAEDEELRRSDLPRQLRVYAGPLSDSLATRLQEALPRTRVVSIYGTTEGGNTTLTRTGAGSQFNLTPADRDVGLWHRYNKRWAKSGELGEILLASGVPVGPPLLIGERVSITALPAGWVGTGDLGRLEADGRLTFLGRSSDIVLRNGERQSALQLEQKLESQGFPPVIVFGLWQRGSEQLCLLLEASGEFDHVRLAALAEASGCAFIMLMASFPRTPLGKIRRREVIAKVVSHLAAGANAADLTGTKIYDLRR